ncbi:hypothetical protein B0T18DRAFT_443537 [Schizothecium vesticola]|uniref:Uncharacterized protein n=1 Tax=Schizothecium vesticola TaxID=314040 RepID=A0AA40K9M7_9PEZI|nr:hypothetical protein B0T18DRAFT_443537 [Schizothecium vesticola]
MAVLESITATRALGAVAILAVVQFAVMLTRRTCSRDRPPRDMAFPSSRTGTCDMFGASMATVLLEDHPEFSDVDTFYIDPWPIADTMIYMTAELRPWTGNKDVVTSEDAHRHRWRTFLNPGFSAKNIISMVPGFLEETRVFKDCR